MTYPVCAHWVIWEALRDVFEGEGSTRRCNYREFLRRSSTWGLNHPVNSLEHIC